MPPPASVPTYLFVDGTAVVFRAFFAVRDLTAPDGSPVNALFGFVRLLAQLISHVAPDRVVVAFDGGSPASRLSLLPDYKAQRPPVPDALRCQFAPINEFLRLAGIPSVLLPHQEADDVLATLATRAEAAGALVRIATADKDLMQLVSPTVSLLAQSKDLQVTDAARVFEKTGVHPGQIVEWLALVGDTADNIPGVPGVGPKTAARLLEQFGSLDACYAALPLVSSPALRERLAAARPVLDRNIALMTLDRDVPGVPSLAALAPAFPSPPSPGALRDFYLARGLRRFAEERLFGAAPPVPPSDAPVQLSLF